MNKPDGHKGRQRGTPSSAKQASLELRNEGRSLILSVCDKRKEYTQGERERERVTEKQRESETARQRDRETARQRDRETGGLLPTPCPEQSKAKTERQRDGDTETQEQRQRDTQRKPERQRERERAVATRTQGAPACEGRATAFPFGCMEEGIDQICGFQALPAKRAWGCVACFRPQPVLLPSMTWPVGGWTSCETTVGDVVFMCFSLLAGVKTFKQSQGRSQRREPYRRPCLSTQSCHGVIT